MIGFVNIIMGSPSAGRRQLAGGISRHAQKPGLTGKGPVSREGGSLK